MFGAEEGDEDTPADPQQAAARRKQLVFELNRNGQYLRLKDQLKAAVVGIVKESYHKSGSMGRQEMQAGQRPPAALPNPPPPPPFSPLIARSCLFIMLLRRFQEWVFGPYHHKH